MKKIIAVFLIIATVLTAATAVTQAELNSKMNAFTDQLADFIPRASASSNLWADAHIGNIIPLNGLPHLGAGMTAGAALIPTDLLATVNEAFPEDTSSSHIFPIPTISFDARIGGLILPFDVGAHVMLVQNSELKIFGSSITLTNCASYGADIRLAILQEGVIIPALSIGVGYTKTAGEFELNSTNSLGSTNSGIISSLLNSNTHQFYMNGLYSAEIYMATAQISKKILFLTPFAGARAIVQNGTYSCEYSYDNISGTKEKKRSFSFNDLMNSNPKLSVFAGLGADFIIIQTTVGVSYDFSDSSWAGSLSIHVKI